MSRIRSEASNWAASSAPSLSWPSSAAGRCSGVRVRNVKMPEMCGWPSGVRIIVSDWADCAPAGIGATNAAAIANAMTVTNR